MSVDVVWMKKGIAMWWPMDMPRGDAYVFAHVYVRVCACSRVCARVCESPSVHTYAGV